MDSQKPGSSSTQSGSKQAVANSSASTQGYASRLASSIPPHIQVLSPEELVEEYDMEIEELGSSGSEYTDDSEDDGNLAFTGRTESVFGIAEPLTDRSKLAPSRFDSQSQQSEDDYLAVRQLALLENESDEISVCSEEERDIMAEIRAEITQKVREEMKSELEVYKKAKENLNKDNKEDDLAAVEPELKAAILKMRKLDKILEKKIKREKQVKRERIMLEKRLHEELENLKSASKKKITADEKKNTEKFLALTLPPSHNAGVSLDEPQADVPPASPVFQTQIPEVNEQKDTARNTQSDMSKSDVRNSTSGASQSGATSVSGTSTLTEDSTGRKIRRRKKKNFIKRNIKLAAEAAAIVAMTDDEKKRLEDLLNDLDTLPETGEDVESTQGDVSNPFHVALAPGDGFTPTPNQKQRLDDIDMRLRSVLPPEEFMSITSGSVTSLNHNNSVLFTRTTMSSLGSELDGGNALGVGEFALREAKEKREQQERLRRIEEELSQLTNAVQHEMDSPCLTDEQLNKLLDECTRTMSRATEETNSLANSQQGQLSARSSLYENPPRLPEPVLQKLLEDARKELAGEQRNTNAERKDDLLLESFSEECSVRNSRMSSQIEYQSAARTSATSEHMLLRLRQTDSPVKCYSPKTQSRLSQDSERRPFLPEIDPKGRMSTKRLSGAGLNNDQTVSSPQPVYRTLSEVYTIRNSLTNGQVGGDLSDSDSDKSDYSASQDENDSAAYNNDEADDDDDDDKTPTPHPPSSRRSGSQSHGRTRFL